MFFKYYVLVHNKQFLRVSRSVFYHVLNVLSHFAFLVAIMADDHTLGLLYISTLVLTAASSMWLIATT